MKLTPLACKKAIATLALATSLAGAGGLVAVNTALAATQMVATTSVNLRSGPGTSYSILTVVQNGATVSATGTTSGGWVQVTYNGVTGYVASNYLTAVSGGSSATATGTAVATQSVNVRTGPSTSYAVIGVASAGQSVGTTGTTSGGWTQVIFNGRTAWIYSSYLSTSTLLGSSATLISSAGVAIVGQARTTDELNVRTSGTSSASIYDVLPANSVVDLTGQKTASYSQIAYDGRLLWVATAYLAPISTSPSYATSDRAQRVVDWAYSQIGKAYVWGAEGPDAYDCSGFVMKAYAQVGVSLPHYSVYQSQLGTGVSYASMKPGDVIAWYSPVQHVSIYVGNGQMIHARGSKYGVVSQSVAQYNGWAPINTIRRFV